MYDMGDNMWNCSEGLVFSRTIVVSVVTVFQFEIILLFSLLIFFFFFPIRHSTSNKRRNTSLRRSWAQTKKKQPHIFLVCCTVGEVQCGMHVWYHMGWYYVKMFRGGVSSVVMSHSSRTMVVVTVFQFISP